MRKVETYIFVNEVEDDRFHLGWYFSDETSELHGPFSTIEETRTLLNNYVKSLEEESEELECPIMEGIRLDGYSDEEEFDDGDDMICPICCGLGEDTRDQSTCKTCHGTGIKQPIGDEDE